MIARPLPRRLLAALASLALLTAAAAPGTAAADAVALERALALLRLPSEAFVAAQRGAPEPPFDWSSDGCSRTPPAWARVFDPACRQHDFGYRNLGRGLRLERTEERRVWIDRRMLTESRRICARRRGRGLARVFCSARAEAMHAAVRLFNAPWS